MTLVEKLINEHNQVVQYAEESPEKDGFLNGMKKAIDIVKNHDGWIKIKDGGFDDGQEILITDGKEVWTDTVMFDYEDGVHFCYFDEGSDPESVTHWQPKPEPPKE